MSLTFTRFFGFSLTTCLPGIGVLQFATIFVLCIERLKKIGINHSALVETPLINPIQGGPLTEGSAKIILRFHKNILVTFCLANIKYTIQLKR